MSHGQRVRGGLCRSFLSQADLIILDEPLAGLDADAVKNFVKVLRAHRAQGKTILMSTHSVEDVGPITDRWMEMNQGRLWVLPKSS